MSKHKNEFRLPRRIAPTCILATVACALWGQSVQAQAPKPVIAVFNIIDSSGVLNAASIEQLTNYFTVKLAESGRFVVVPKSDIEAALRAQKRASYKECFDQSCQIEVGKELAAQKTLRTQIVKLGSKCAVTGTLYDLRLAASEKAASKKSDCTEDGLVSALERLALALSGAAPTAQKAILSINTTPPGASLQLNGQLLSQKSPVAALVVDPGELRITASLGELKKVMTVRLAPGEKKIVMLNLRKPSGQLTINTAPQGATVMFDGKRLGKSPLEHRAPQGAHKLRLRLDGFLDKEVQVALQNETTISVTMDRAASVNISTEPPGATVRRNKKGIGRSPLTVFVEPGEHVFSAQLNGYQPAEQRVQIGDSQRSTPVRIELRETEARRRARAAYRSRLTDYQAQLVTYQKDNSNLLGWISFGAGLAAAGSSGVLFGLTVKRKQSYDSSILRADLDAEHSGGRRSEIAAYVLGSAALAAIVHSIIQWSLGPDEPERPAKPAWFGQVSP